MAWGRRLWLVILWEGVVFIESGRQVNLAQGPRMWGRVGKQVSRPAIEEIECIGVPA
jgi:hypothetical protein